MFSARGDFGECCFLRTYSTYSDKEDDLRRVDSNPIVDATPSVSPRAPLVYSNG